MRAVMKQTAAALAAGLLAAGVLTGCAQKEMDYASTVAAVYGSTPIYLDEANFMARYSQWYDELYYISYLGNGMWQQEYGGKTLEAATKEEVMAALLQTEALISHAEEYGVELTEEDREKIDKACADFLGQISQEMKEASHADEALVKRVFEKNALANKVWQAAVADINMEVTEEESQQTGVRYILVREETGEAETAESTAGGESPEESGIAESPEVKANAIAGRIRAGEDIETVAEELGLPCNTAHYARYGESDPDDVVETAAASMAAGEVCVTPSEGTGWYVIYYDTENDEKATADEVDKIIRQRKADRFKEVYAGWEKAEFKVDEDVWSQIIFDKNPVYVPETAGNTEVETAGSTSAEPETAGSAETGTATPPKTEETGKTAAE